MEKAIVDYVKSKGGGVTFVELCRDVAGFEGEYAMHVGDFENLILWNRVSKEGIKGLVEAMRHELIEINTTGLLTYAIDGQFLNLPIAKRIYPYKKPRWLPVFFNAGPFSELEGIL